MYYFAKERLCCGDIAPRAEPEVDGLAGSIPSPIEISLPAAEPYIGLVFSPKGAGRRCKTAPAFVELKCIPLNSAKAYRIRDRQAALGNHLGQVSVRACIADTSARTKG